MRKFLILAAVATTLFSCQETETKKEDFKTGYIDSAVLLEKYEKFKDEADKLKVKYEEAGRPYETREKQLMAERESLQRAAQANGPAWVQQNQQRLADFEKRSQDFLQAKQQALAALEEQTNKQQDSLVKDVRKYIKEYGKKEGFDYIFLTNDASNIIYAKDGYNLTDKLLKQLNEEYKTNKEKK